MKSINYSLWIFLTVIAFGTMAADDITDETGFQSFGDNYFESNLLFGIESQESISLIYGIADPMIHKDAFKSDISRTGSFELRFNKSVISDMISDTTSLKEYSSHYLALGNMSTVFYDDKIDDNLEVSSWKFSIGDDEGYGYALGENSNIFLYNGSTMHWSKPDFKDAPLAEEVLEKIKVYDDDIRFGREFEAGLIIQPFEFLSVNTAYTRTTVYPRTMFWYMSGSDLLQFMGEVLVDKINDKIFKKFPYAGPITHFILRNAYSYGFSKLREKQMHFPFGPDTAPLIYDQYRIGLTFHF
ncbi:MAG: hypothetical protein PF588_08575 [Candidatus Kapabacteria bacterium]|jgi:hypothetical protein|nr:hypothetical protein [Candidatus Kapabacteria bacterium]